jgi:hypothetical protein
MELIFYMLIEHTSFSICVFSLEIFKTLKCLFFSKLAMCIDRATLVVSVQLLLHLLGKPKCRAQCRMTFGSISRGNELLHKIWQSYRDIVW